jgi:carboxypeptidase Q
MNRSQVMQTLSYLSDVIGPRLTGSPSLKMANNWTKDKLSSWGLQNAHLEPWGPFGRGWSMEHFAIQVSAPTVFPLIAYPRAWCGGLAAPVTAEVVLVDATDAAGLEQYKGKLKGAIVLMSPARQLQLLTEPQTKRYTDDELAKLAAPPDPNAAGNRRQGGNRQGGRPGLAGAQFAGQKQRFVEDEGCAAEIYAATGDDGTIYVQSASVAPAAQSAGTAAPAAGAPAPRRLQPWDKDAGKMVPQISVSAEQYNRLVRMIGFGVKPRITLDLAVKYYDDDPMAYNTVAEIPGTDKKDEIVMLGGHMDSWHSGTGATDNGAGVAVCMEAVRILNTLGLKPRRTIRLALWSGEEEGLFGSHAYVAEHFGSYPARAGGGFGQQRDPNAPPPVLTKKADYDKLAAYFNLDNGAGKIRGVYLQGNEAVRPIFQEWLTPFKDMGASTLTIRNTGSTDHVSFDGIGLPGFQFIQDGLEYGSRTHHSNQDVFDRVPVDDMKQASVIMAAFVYGAAMRDDKLPHKPAAAN